MRDTKEIREKSLEQLYKDISEAYKKLREVRFRMAHREIKDTNEKHKLRRRIARLLTIVREKEAERMGEGN